MIKEKEQRRREGGFACHANSHSDLPRATSYAARFIHTRLCNQALPVLLRTYSKEMGGGSTKTSSLIVRFRQDLGAPILLKLVSIKAYKIEPEMASSRRSRR
jgi:hypothetical protein